MLYPRSFRPSSSSSSLLPSVVSPSSSPNSPSSRSPRIYPSSFRSFTNMNRLQKNASVKVRRARVLMSRTSHRTRQWVTILLLIGILSCLTVWYFFIYNDFIPSSHNWFQSSSISTPPMNTSSLLHSWNITDLNLFNQCLKAQQSVNNTNVLSNTVPLPLHNYTTNLTTTSSSKLSRQPPIIVNDLRFIQVIDKVLTDSGDSINWINNSLNFIHGISNNNDTTNPSSSTTTTSMDESIESMKPYDLRVAGSSVGSSRILGNPLFGFIGREPSSFTPILDGISPRSTPLSRKQGLLAIPVSGKAQQSISPIINLFLKEMFDVMLFHYDLADWSQIPYYANCISIRVPGQTKFWYAKRFLVPQLLDNYDYIFLWDDDIGLTSNWSPSRFVAILQRFGIHAAQPALRDGARPQYPQFNTVRHHPEIGQSGSPGRFTEFVEVMFPVFSREAWQNCIWESIPYDGRSFWGIDNAWYPHCASAGYCRFAVIDAMPVDHLDQRSLEQHNGNNLRELAHYLNMYRDMCAARPSDVDGPTSRRILYICNYILHHPFGKSYRSLLRIDPDTHSGPEFSRTCIEPELWPGIENRPWYANEPVTVFPPF